MANTRPRRCSSHLATESETAPLGVHGDTSELVTAACHGRMGLGAWGVRRTKSSSVSILLPPWLTRGRSHTTVRPLLSLLSLSTVVGGGSEVPAPR